MSNYQLTWITDNLAVGHAPMSYADLDAIRAEGIDAIVNLCGEFCDLHELEEQRGFEVYYLPIPDECAPDMVAMEEALAWLDEAVYLGKKVLIHCRFGIGRTGTFLTAYLIRRGMGLKLASRRLKKVRSQPSSFRQWRVLKKYGKQSGTLQVREPSLENRRVVDLSPFFGEYESLVREVDQELSTTAGQADNCGRERDNCCFAHFELSLVEAVYLFNVFNRTLTREARQAVIHRAVGAVKNVACQYTGDNPPMEIEDGSRERNLQFACPLNEGGQCLLFAHRPLRCRLDQPPPSKLPFTAVQENLDQLSQHVFMAFSGDFFDPQALTFTVAETVSGRFVQKYFYYLAGLNNTPSTN